MEQMTFDDEDLFGEAAGELRADVKDSLAAGWDSLPDVDRVWNVEADNVLGVLNALRTTLTVDEAREHLREAKKWFTLGESANAFDDADALRRDIERLEETVTDLDTVREEASELASTLPRIREALQEAAEAPTPDPED